MDDNKDVLNDEPLNSSALDYVSNNSNSQEGSEIKTEETKEELVASEATKVEETTEEPVASEETKVEETTEEPVASEETKVEETKEESVASEETKVEETKEESVEAKETKNEEPQSVVINEGVSFNTDAQPKKKRKKLPIIIVLIVIVLFGVAAGGYYFYANRTETIVTAVVNDLYGKFENSISEVENFDVSKESMLLNADMSFKTNIAQLKSLENVELNLNFGMDFKNKKIESGVTLSEDSKELIEVLGYILNDNIYVSFKDDYPSLINIGTTNLSELFTKSDVNIDDIKYLMKEYKNILLKSINMDDFEKSSATITLNGKEESVTKLTYVFDASKQKALTKNIMNNAAEDNEFIDRFSKVTGTSSSELKSTFKDTSILDSEELYTEPMTLSLYIKGLSPELVGADITNADNDIQVRINDKDTVVKLKTMTQDMTITIKEENNITKLNMQTQLNGKDFNLDTEITKNKKDDKNYDGLVKLIASYDNQNFEADIDYKITMGAKISDIDVSKAKSVNSITQIELDNLQQKIYTKLQKSKLFNMVMSLTQSY